MRYRLLFVLFLILPLCNSAFAVEKRSSLSCATGPLHKSYGGTPWLVYSCSDRKTLIIITATGSPAMPYVFTFSLKKGKYHLRGKGKGNRNLTKAAYKELHRFSDTHIQKLINQTKTVRLSKKRHHKSRLTLH